MRPVTQFDLFGTVRQRSPIEIERARRMRVCIWAYAYEIEDRPLVDDHTFDRECQKIDVRICTGNNEMDAWFKENFDPCTGSWIHAHPNHQWLAEKCAVIREAENATNE